MSFAYPTTCGEARDLVLVTTEPATLFGEDEPEQRRRYRALSRLLHPDAGGDAAAFSRLGDLWRQLRGGEPARGRTIHTRRRSYVVGDLVRSDSVCQSFDAIWQDEDGAIEHGLMRMPRSPRDSDLVATEAAALKALAEGDEALRPFVPKLVESFRHRERRGTEQIERRASVVTIEEPSIPGRWVTLEQVMAAFPDGLDPRDAAWVWRRLLHALRLPHGQGWVHGAVTPQNVLVHPEAHGLVLANWCHAVKVGEKIVARDKRWISLYPSEAVTGEPVVEATDVHLATKTMARLMRGRATTSIRAFMRGCTLERSSMRPSDVGRLCEELDDLLETLYGPRKFRELVMPASVG